MEIENFRAATVGLGERSYHILAGEGLLARLGEAANRYVPDATGCVVVTSPDLDQLYGDTALRSLRRLNPARVLLPEGETAKTWGWAGRLVSSLIDHRLDRKGVVVALGGGSVGDVAGFAAAIYLRGVRVIQVPTTLLSQVDSSIGGKTAVNHSLGKNVIGAFHQPSLVVCDTSLLKTLPKGEIRSGLAEVVKYGVINDANLFATVEEKADRLLSADAAELEAVVARCAAIKAGYVELDERDTSGVRATLNYGHTVGHAIETLNRGRIRHGEGVAIGMVSASRVSVEYGLLHVGELERQANLLGKLGLPTRVPTAASSRLIKIMHRDKKAESGTIRLVLPTGIGVPPVTRAVPDAVIERSLEA